MSSQSQDSGNSKKGRKDRFVFTIQKDNKLLSSRVQHNPWQLGDDKWADIAAETINEEGWDVTTVSIRSRVKLLLNQFNRECLKVKTGTEEEQTERGSLLVSVAELVAMAKGPINIQLDGEDEGQIPFEIGDGEIVVSSETEIVEVRAGTSTSTKTKAANGEKVQADKERDLLLEKATDLAPSPNENRRKLLRMSPEDEMIKVKQEHDMNLENRRIDLEGRKIDNDYLLEESA